MLGCYAIPRRKALRNDTTTDKLDSDLIPYYEYTVKNREEQGED